MNLRNLLFVILLDRIRQCMNRLVGWLPSWASWHFTSVCGWSIPGMAIC